MARPALQRLRESIERNRETIETAIQRSGNPAGASMVDGWLRLIAAAEREESAATAAGPAEEDGR